MDIPGLDAALEQAGCAIPPPLAEGEFTVNMLAKLKRINYDTAKDIIKKCVEAGVFEAVGIRHALKGGVASEAYRVVIKTANK
jgi:hypothetical protein